MAKEYETVSGSPFDRIVAAYRGRKYHSVLSYEDTDREEVVRVIAALEEAGFTVVERAFITT